MFSFIFLEKKNALKMGCRPDSPVDTPKNMKKIFSRFLRFSLSDLGRAESKVEISQSDGVSA